MIGALFRYDVDPESQESGYQITYRKTYTPNGQCKIEMKQLKMTVKEVFKDCKTIKDYEDAGLSESIVENLFGDKSKSTRISEKILNEIQDINVPGVDELFDIDNKEEIWFENPGGIASNIISRLPKFLLIPDMAETETLSGKKGSTD